MHKPGCRVQAVSFFLSLSRSPSTNRKADLFFCFRYLPAQHTSYFQHACDMSVPSGYFYRALRTMRDEKTC